MPLTIHCPECRRPLDVDDEYRTWKVRCPECRHEFFAEEAAGPRPDRSTYPPPPGRPRRRRRPLDDDELVDEVRHLVAGPGSTLKVLGFLGIAFGILGVVLYVALGVWAINQPAKAQKGMNAPNQAEMIGNIVGGAIGSAVTAVCGVLTVIGGGKMMTLESRGWATAAAVLAIIPCTNWCCLMGLPVGIWAINVLNRADVRDAFAVVERQHHHGERPTDDDEDD